MKVVIKKIFDIKIYNILDNAPWKWELMPLGIFWDIFEKLLSKGKI